MLCNIAIDIKRTIRSSEKGAAPHYRHASVLTIVMVVKRCGVRRMSSVITAASSSRVAYSLEWYTFPLYFVVYDHVEYMFNSFSIM